jgi:uroporphyrinogen-III synthase
VKRVLLTGPSENLSAWSAAVREAAWEPIEHPLLEIVPLGVDPEAVIAAGARFDWLCVTSRNALHFVEHAAARRPQVAGRAAAIGEPASRRLRELGFDVALDPASDAHELAARLIARFAADSAQGRPSGTRVLWPRGDRSDELARLLRPHGFHVEDPIVYESRARDDRVLPECEVVFFASPSAVHAWNDSATGAIRPRLAIAIGPTTFETLLVDAGGHGWSLLALSEPTPEALRHALSHVDPS